LNPLALWRYADLGAQPKLASTVLVVNAVVNANRANHPTKKDDAEIRRHPFSDCLRKALTIFTLRRY
jgi:hypothetical protein